MIILIVLAIIATALVSAAIGPWVAVLYLRETLNRIHHLEYAVTCIQLDADPSDDDPDGGESKRVIDFPRAA